MNNYLHMPPYMMYRVLFPTIYIQLRTIANEKNIQKFYDFNLCEEDKKRPPFDRME